MFDLKNLQKKPIYLKDGTKDELTKMLKNSKEKGFQAKQDEVSDGKKHTSFSKPTSTTTSSRQWSTFRNPRIVRVSRSFGGKDRHSKVCTIRGLRDRRIRLSVPTAIQLYDLQDKLRLGQPSKVIDWLLEVTKLDIDKLPPLQIPAGFTQFHQQMLFPHDPSSNSPQFSFPPTFFDVKDASHFKEFDQNQTMMGRSKLSDPTAANDSEKGKWINNSNHIQIGDYNPTSLPNYLLNNATAFNYYTTNPDHQFGNNNFPIHEAQTSSSSNSSSAFFFCPSNSSNPSSAAVFTPYPSLTNPFESHIQFLSSNSVHALPANPFMASSFQPFTSQNLKPFSGNFNLKQLLQSSDHNNNNNNGGGSSGKDHHHGHGSGNS